MTAPLQASPRSERSRLFRMRRRQSLARGRMTLIMGLFGVVFIFITFGYIAWEQRNRLIQRNQDEIASAAFFLADHAARLLEVTDLALKQTTTLIQGEGWDRIEESEPMWNQLRAIREALPYIDNVWLNDATGRLRLTSVRFPTPPSNVADRDAFRAQVASDQGLFVSEPLLGRVTDEPTFMISRRLTDPTGAFNGIASVTVALSYFNDYWGKLRLPHGARITLLRARDGKTIAQYPPPPDSLAFVPINEEAFARTLAESRQSGMYVYNSVGIERIGAYRQAEDWPLYIQVSLPEDAYWKPWLVQTKIYGAFALIAFLALGALTALASQQFQEQAANEALLERQVALRTGELQAETAALEVLNRTGSALAGELDIDRIVQNVTDAGVLLTGAQFGAFFLKNGEAQEGQEGANGYRLYALSGEEREAFERLPMLRSTGIFSPTLEDGWAVRSDDITADPRYGRNEPYQGMPPGHPPVRSYMAVPVFSRAGEIHGALLFGHDRSGVFSARAERLVTGLAGQAAIALENGRLYRNAQREIDERRQAQAQQSLLIRELHHRVKNTLATVQAVVGATARSTSNIDDFYTAFVGRIISLANTHSLLTEAVWQTASLRGILEKELSPYNDHKGGRVTLDGPAVELPSEVAVPLGMAIHELTTNAAKYGALSVSTGRVAVAWSSQQEEEGMRLRITWQERGGPPVAPPKTHGFGSRLLHRVLTTQLNAQVDIAYEPEGLRATVETVLKKAELVDPVA